MKLRWLVAAAATCLAHAVLAQEPVPLRPALEPAGRDPFAVAAQSAPPQVTASKPAPAPPPPPPQAPALNLVFAGTMVSPNGKRVVFGMVGDSAVTLARGTVLSNGYEVRSVSDTAVELVYPPLGTQATLQIPPAPSFEVR